MNFGNNYGQVAFESLVLLLVIITASIYITGLYMQTHNTTLGYSIARTQLTEQANSFEEVVVIDTLFIKDNNILEVTTIPPTYTNNDFNLNIIKNKINQQTSLGEIEIEIN